MDNKTFYMQLLQQKQGSQLSFTAEQIDILLKKIHTGIVLSNEEYTMLKQIQKAYEEGTLSGGGNGGGNCDCSGLTEEEITELIGAIPDDDTPENEGHSCDCAPIEDEDIEDVIGKPESGGSDNNGGNDGPVDAEPFTDEDIDEIWDSVVGGKDD